jgi:rhamnosyltransferase
MRSHNDLPILADTLRGLAGQRAPFTLISFDNASTDGSREAVAAMASEQHQVPAGQYVPGRVLNDAMVATTSEIVVFLNADCVPADDQWLARLLDAFADPAVAAAFSRQRPREGCDLFQARDTEATYGDGALQARWKHCFSMAASAIRRSAWLEAPFREDLQYSEDIDWSWRARRRGHRIAYVSGSAVFHSHNYSLAQLYRRHHGEGRAEAAIFSWTAWERSFLRYTLLPWARQVMSDWRTALRARSFSALARAPLYRAVQAAGRRQGFRLGSMTAFSNGHAR